MKKIILIIGISLACSSCASIPKEVQEDFNQSATYFIQTDGPKLIEYLDKDTSLTLREKEATKRRYKNLLDIIAEMNQQ